MNTKKYEELLVLLRSHKTDKEILEVCQIIMRMILLICLQE